MPYVFVHKYITRYIFIVMNMTSNSSVREMENHNPSVQVGSVRVCVQIIY